MTKKRSKRTRNRRKIEYRPTSVRELLTEMKDTSEHIIDLAYTALIFDSREMKEEVEKLEEKMDEYLYLIRMNAMLAARTKEDAEQLSGILQVATAAEGISDAADDIAAIAASKSDLRLLLPLLLKEAEGNIERVRIAPGSDMDGSKVGGLKVEEVTGTRIIAIKRKWVWRYEVDGNAQLFGNDVLFVKGSKEGIDELRLYASGSREWDTYRRGVDG